MNQIEPAFEADLLAAFTGLSFMPKIYTLTHNNAVPVLRLYEELIEYRGGFRLKESDYSNISKVDIFTILFTKSICLYFKDTPRTFYGNFRRDSERVACLKIFMGKGCQLTEEALVLVGVLK
jgi:hypothetical protein